MTDSTACLDPGQARFCASDCAPSHTPTPASEEPGEPLSDHLAYVVGLEASRHGIDLAEVVFDAIACWPGTTGEICEAIASAALGWCVDQWRQDRRGEP
ncbi:MAG: hypothetical protein ACLQGP_06840 [Isosphaeraceae bacterium]